MAPTSGAAAWSASPRNCPFRAVAPASNPHGSNAYFGRPNRSGGACRCKYYPITRCAATRPDRRKLQVLLPQPFASAAASSAPSWSRKAIHSCWNSGPGDQAGQLTFSGSSPLHPAGRSEATEVSRSQIPVEAVLQDDDCRPVPGSAREILTRTGLRVAVFGHTTGTAFASSCVRRHLFQPGCSMKRHGLICAVAALVINGCTQEKEPTKPRSATGQLEFLQGSTAALYANLPQTGVEPSPVGQVRALDEAVGEACGLTPPPEPGAPAPASPSILASAAVVVVGWAIDYLVSQASAAAQKQLAEYSAVTSGTFSSVHRS